MFCAVSPYYCLYYVSHTPICYGQKQETRPGSEKRMIQIAAALHNMAAAPIDDSVNEEPLEFPEQPTS
jgi:hypothetical protein